jgi:hypothetical protein
MKPRGFLLLLLLACGGGDDCKPTEPHCGDDGGDRFVPVVGTWNGTTVEERALPTEVNWTGLAGLEMEITETSISILDDGTWAFAVYGGVPNQSPGRVIGPTIILEDRGTYWHDFGADAQGFSDVQFTSETYTGYTFTGRSNGQVLSFSYDMTSSPGGNLRFTFQLR